MVAVEVEGPKPELENWHGTRVALFGLSGETKPIDVLTGSTFFEMDTADSYMYDAGTQTWYQI